MSMSATMSHKMSASEKQSEELLCMKMALRSVFVNIDHRMNSDNASTEANSDSDGSSEPDVEALVHCVLDEDLEIDEDGTTLAPASSFSTPARSSHQGSPTNLPSLGSAGHAEGTCKRCCFFPKGRCQNGFSCEFCHIEHEKRSRKKTKKSKKVVNRRAPGWPSSSTASDYMVEPSFSNLSVQPPGLESVNATREGSATESSASLHFAALNAQALNAQAAPFVLPMNPDAMPFVPPSSGMPDATVQIMPPAKPGNQQESSMRNTLNYCPSPVLTSSLWAQGESVPASNPFTAQHWKKPHDEPYPSQRQPPPEKASSKDALPQGWEQTVSPDAVLSAMKAYFETQA
jgi:hypothetical protein